MKSYICKICGKEKLGYETREVKYCSISCRSRGHSLAMKGRTPHNKGKSMSEETKRRLSISLRKVFFLNPQANNKVEIVCKTCGKSVFLKKSQAVRARYCSNSCYWKSLKGSTGDKNPSYKGGRRIGSDGYYLLYSPNHPHCDSQKYVREHRLIMEKIIGRYLTKEEVVHHINGNKLDNRADNLMLFYNNSEHVKHHAKGPVLAGR